MSRTKGQIIVNYHTSGTSLPQVDNFELGELVVLHNPNKPELVIKDNNGGLHEFVESAAVISIATEIANNAASGLTAVSAQTVANKEAIELHQAAYEQLYSAVTANTEAVRILNADAATEKSVDNKISNFSGKVVSEFANYATSANTDSAIKALSGNVVANYATSADTQAALDKKLDAAELDKYITSAATVEAIKALSGNVVANYATSAATVGAINALSGNVVNEFKNYATSADTVSAIKAVDDKFDSYATSADTVSAIKAVDDKFDSYATSADTVAAIKAVDDKFDNYATSAATVGAINALSGNVVNEFKNYATSADTQAALDTKVDKKEGYDLSKNDFDDVFKGKLEGIESGAQVNAIESITVNGSATTIDANKNVNIVIPAASEYEIKALSAATSGMAKSYALYKDGKKVGDTIDIAKDMFVCSGGVVTKGDDKYVELILANSANTAIDINVKDLCDVYTGESAITVSDDNVINLLIDEANKGNVVLTQTADGLKASVDLSDYATSADTVSAINALSGNVVNEFKKYATSADTVSAINALSGNVVNEFKNYATSANTEAAIKALSGNVVANYADSAATVGAINALSGNVVNEFKSYATSANTEAAIKALSGNVVANYATSAATVGAINALSGNVVNEFKSYATSANTEAAIKALSGNVVANYATSADTVAAISAISQNSITGITLDGSAVTVTNNVAAITSYISSVEDTTTVDLDVTNGKLTANVIRVDGGEF